jgi:hypothetical protein
MMDLAWPWRNLVEDNREKNEEKEGPEYPGEGAVIKWQPGLPYCGQGL